MVRFIARATVTTLAVAVLLLGLGSTALATSWSDIDNSVLDSYGVTLEQLSQVSAGFPDGSWRPWQSVTRAQFVKMADAAFAIDLAYPTNPTFSDVPATHQYYEYIEGAYSAALIEGVGGGLFAPSAILTREEGIAVVARKVAADQSFDLSAMEETAIAAALAGFADGASVSAGLRAEMAFAITEELVRGTGAGALAPQASMRRIAAAALLLRALETGELVLDETDDGATVEMEVNDTFKVVLKGNPTTGYSWTAVISEQDAGILRQMGEPTYVPDSDLVGAGGTYMFTFEAMAPGQAVLQLEYARPWESVPPEKTFTVTVRVETSPVDGSAVLDGTTWSLEAWAVSSLDPGDFVITAAFDGGQISGKAAVNTYSGPYSADASGVFSVGALARTEIAGPEPAMQAEAAYFGLLEQARAYEVDDDHLTLRAEDGGELLVFIAGPMSVTLF